MNMRFTHLLILALAGFIMSPLAYAADDELSEITVFVITDENASERSNTIQLPIPASAADCNSGKSECVDKASGKSAAARSKANARSGNASNANSGNSRGASAAGSDNPGKSGGGGNSGGSGKSGGGGNKGGNSDRGGSGKP